MAADVSTLHRVLSGYKDDLTVGNESGGAKPTTLITRDLLGGGGGSGSALINIKNDQSQELHLDLQVPDGWEKRLDLKSGKVYLQRCNSSNSSSSWNGTKHQINGTVPKLQDLNFPPSPSKPLLNFFDESNLELKLVSSTTYNNYQSVCTLDTVKFALERAEKEPIKKRSSSSSSLWKSSMSPSYSLSTSSIKESQDDEDEDHKLLASPVAAGCPGCLSYVMIMKHNPKCPRCNTRVPVPATKKPRIDLNISI